jgi:hypothetical protein
VFDADDSEREEAYVAMRGMSLLTVRQMRIVVATAEDDLRRSLLPELDQLLHAARAQVSTPSPSLAP